MNKIAMILRKPPYGDINAAEAVRHAMGAVADDIGVYLLLLDGGVLLAKKSQEEGDSGFTNLGNVLTDCIDMGVEVYAEELSVKEQSLATSDIVDGVKIINASEIAGLVKEAKTTMIF